MKENFAGSFAGSGRFAGAGAKIYAGFLILSLSMSTGLGAIAASGSVDVAGSTGSSGSTGQEAALGSRAETNAAGSSGSAAASAPGAETNAAGASASKEAGQSKDESSPLIFGKKWKKGEELSIGAAADDLVPTDDAEMARKQVLAYPDSPEASFILAVALTRTSRVEEALKEVRRARKLAEQKGGTAYFDSMIATYENMLKDYPNENRVRYGLAWAYYMKAYLLANYSKKVAAWKAANAPGTSPAAASASDTRAGAAASGGAVGAGSTDAVAGLKANLQSGKGLDINSVLGAVSSLAQGKTDGLPKIPSMTDKVEAQDLPQIKAYFQKALSNLDDLLVQKPDDVWALVYRAHLKAEYTGDLTEAMQTWTSCREKFPNNPAAYFFLGEGYLKQGNLKESLNNVSRAVALRSLGY